MTKRREAIVARLKAAEALTSSSSSQASSKSKKHMVKKAKQRVDWSAQRSKREEQSRLDTLMRKPRPVFFSSALNVKIRLSQLPQFSQSKADPYKIVVYSSNEGRQSDVEERYHAKRYFKKASVQLLQIVKSLRDEKADNNSSDQMTIVRHYDYLDSLTLFLQMMKKSYDCGLADLVPGKILSQGSLSLDVVTRGAYALTYRAGAYATKEMVKEAVQSLAKRALFDMLRIDAQTDILADQFSNKHRVNLHKAQKLVAQLIPDEFHFELGDTTLWRFFADLTPAELRPSDLPYEAKEEKLAYDLKNEIFKKIIGDIHNIMEQMQTHDQFKMCPSENYISEMGDIHRREIKALFKVCHYVWGLYSFSDCSRLLSKARARVDLDPKMIQVLAFIKACASIKPSMTKWQQLSLLYDAYEYLIVREEGMSRRLLQFTDAEVRQFPGILASLEEQVRGVSKVPLQLMAPVTGSSVVAGPTIFVRPPGVRSTQNQAIVAARSTLKAFSMSSR